MRASSASSRRESSSPPPSSGSKYSVGEGASATAASRMPSGVAPLVVLDPKGAALGAAKVFGQYDPVLRERVRAAHADLEQSIRTSDQSLRDADEAS